MKKHNEKFLKDNRLPFAECRYSQSSQSVFKPHMHASFSVGAVDSGLVHYRVGNATADLQPGALALINPETLHSCNPSKGKGRSYYMLYLDADWCYTVQRSLWHIDKFIPVDTIRLDDQQLYDRYCDVMQQIMRQDIHLQEKEQLLFDLVCAVFQKSCKPQVERNPLSEKSVLLKQLLKKDLEKDYTLDSLALVLNTNPYTLLRKFKAETGITPHAYRMNCRIEQAKRLLQRGTDITETAFLCGFFDQSHLHRQFKAMTTVTPQEYRINFVQ